MSVCCIIGACCPPGSDNQARHLAKDLGIELEAAVAVTGKYRLVPLDLGEGAQREIDAMIKVWLEERGLPTTEE